MDLFYRHINRFLTRDSTILANTIKGDLVSMYDEAVGCHPIEIAGAFIHIESSAARIAAEVVVVPFPGEFISSGLAGEFNGLDLALFFE